jgi:hypothetical protein
MAPLHHQTAVHHLMNESMNKFAGGDVGFNVDLKFDGSQ